MLKHGVLQGSVLVPIFFLIYVDNVNHARNTVKCTILQMIQTSYFLTVQPKNLIIWHETSICMAKYQQNFSKCTEEWISDL